MSDTFSFWLNQAGRYPLLSEEETHNIATQIQALPQDSPKRVELVNKLCVHNLRLVVKFGRTYASTRCHQWGSDKTLDLLQQGYLGLRRAAEKFDPTRGYRFSTYANPWIRQAMGRWHVDQMSLIRVPESTARDIFYYRDHGKPRTSSVANWIEAASEACTRAYGMVSFDSTLNDDLNQLDLIPQEASLTHRESKKEVKESEYRKIMEEAGLNADAQNLIFSYVRVGSIERLGQEIHRDAGCIRPIIRGGIAKIQEHLGIAC